MNDTNDLPFSKMLDWLEGRLSTEEAARVAQKLETADASTLADLHWLRSFLEMSQTARAASLPLKVRTNLREQFREAVRETGPPSVFRRLLATLTFDSRAQFAAAGVRSAAAEGQQRQLIYDTALAEIALNLQPGPQDQRLTLIGQIFPKGDLPPRGFSIQLVAADGYSEAGYAASNELGEFTVESLPPGQYAIFIMTAGFEIVLPDVSLRH